MNENGDTKPQTHSRPAAISRLVHGAAAAGGCLFVEVATMAERLIRIDAVAAKSPGSMSRFCLTTEQTTSIAADLRQRGWVVDFYDCEDEHDQALIDTLIAGVWPLAPMKLIESLACEYLNNGPTLLAHGE